MRRAHLKCAFFLAWLSLQLCCTGCWPCRFTTSPAVKGIVIDDQTSAPVDGAEIFLSHANYAFPKYAFDPVTHQLKPGAVPQPPSLSEAIKLARPPTVISDGAGSFSIPREQRWGIYIVPMDVFAPQGTLVIRRQGYNDLMLSVSSSNGSDLGSIRLKRVPP